jgi:hypothetical protein
MEYNGLQQWNGMEDIIHIFLSQSVLPEGRSFLSKIIIGMLTWDDLARKATPKKLKKGD